VVKEAAELRPSAAGDVEAVAQEALEVTLALPVLTLLGGQARAVAAQVSRTVAAGEPLVRKMSAAAPAEMAALSAGHGSLPGGQHGRPPLDQGSACAICIWFGV
jgi:hypothetical protein